MAISIQEGDIVDISLPTGGFYAQVEVIETPNNNFPWWEFEESLPTGEAYRIVCGSNLVSIRKLI